MVRSNVKVIIEELTADAPTLDQFRDKLNNLPREVKIDLNENIDVDELLEALERKQQEKNRNLTSYHNDIYY